MEKQMLSIGKHNADPIGKAVVSSTTLSRIDTDRVLNHINVSRRSG
jgi:hypothetical protein